MDKVALVEKSYLNHPDQEAWFMSGHDSPLNYIDIKENDRCLDLGCGTGKITLLMSQKTKNMVYGIDIRNSIIEYASSKRGTKNCIFKQGDYSQRLPFEDDSFDVIVSNWSFNEEVDKSLVMKEIYRLLKVGGKFLFIDITAYENIKNGVYRYSITRSEYEKIMLESFFKKYTVVKEYEINPKRYKNPRLFSIVIGGEK